MKFIKLSCNNTSSVSSEIYKNDNGTFHNVKHGMYGKHLWMWSASLDVKIFPVIDETPIVLDRDDYLLHPIKIKGKAVRDNKDNVLYKITRDNMVHHKNDILVFWEPVLTNIIKLSYTLEGDVSEIGIGYSGKSRLQDYYIPTPILEVTGDCVLKWEGSTKEGEVYTQTVTYDYKTGVWTIPFPIKKIKE